jgi:putative oxidoreductase
MSQKPFSSGWNVTAWIIQILMAFGTFAPAQHKWFNTKAELLAEGKQMIWVQEVPDWMFQFSSIAEVLIGLGLILPALFKIKPLLTIYAAYGLILLHLTAAGVHMYIHDSPMMNAMYIVFGVIIVWIRRKKAVLH